MMANFLARSFWALIYSVIIGSAIYCNDDREHGENLENNQPRFTPYISPCLLPNILVTVFVVYLVTDSITEKPLDYFSFFSGCIAIFLHIGIYYIVLTPLLPAFRRRISARACAMLWLLPNYLYFTHNTFMRLPQPLLVLPVPNSILGWTAAVWAVGFTAVLAKHILTHLHYRRAILRDAHEITDPAILETWQQELEFAGMTKKRCRLVRSPAVRTPLTIGFFKRSIRVVLPQRHYAPEELTLILRHEIVHIGREDSATKFFLVFCTAMCWFNPLMWLAMRRSADDLELSCDETVLLAADDSTRRQYADLLLRTAGDERGFTTCLSASAQALRYRLQNVVHPRKRRTGGLAVALMFYLLIMSCGYVALGYDQVSGQELIFGGHDPDLVTIEEVSRLGSSSGNDLDWLFYKYNCTDEERLTEYISGLNFCKVTGNYSYSDDSRSVSVRYATPTGDRTLYLEGNSLTLWILGDNKDRETYCCTGQLDWDLLHSLIVPHPRLDVALSAPDIHQHFKQQLSPHAHILRTISDDVTKEYPPASPDSVTELHSQELCYRNATFSFTHPLYDGTYEVLVENWDRTSSYTISSEAFEEPFVLELPPYFAHYTVWATIVDDKGVIYDTEYRFDLGPLNQS